MTYDVFISYSRKDMAVADEITRALDAAGISYFIDRQGIAGGMEFPAVLARAIIESRVFLFLASRNSYASKFTNNEITFAFNKKERNRILPYIIDDSQLPVEMEFVFAGINWRTRSQHPVATLVADLRALLGHSAGAAGMQPTEKELKDWFGKGSVAYDRKDYGEALIWYQKAAEYGHSGAQCNLGVMYEGGMGVERDSFQAARWYRMAAGQGNVAAQHNLGYMYAHGRGVAEDFSEALRWYMKAAEQGYARSQCNIGFIYAQGKGVAQDYAEAARWFRMAAEQGSTLAQYNLGGMYENGYGLPKDSSEAARWYRKAADNGHADAKARLEQLTK